LGSAVLKKNKLIIGTAIFIFGQPAPLLIPVVSCLKLEQHWKIGITAFLMLGVPELAIIAACAVLGKDGYLYIKSKIYNFFGRFAPADHVGMIRYRVGLLLFIIPLFLAFIAPYAGSFIPGYDKYTRIYGVAGDLMLLVSLFVPGSEFFDKLRSLFIY
jgi:hypothetical protein